MKKKNIILASILGASALAVGVTGVILTDSNNQNNTVLAENLAFNESNLAEDGIFAQGISSEKCEYPVLMTENETSEIVKPKIGCQYAYDDVNETVSIRFFGAIASEKVDAIWTRALYNADGSVNEALSVNTRQSTVAYKYISYTDGGNILTKSATEEEDENGDHPYNYYVIYTLTDIPVSSYQNCRLRVTLELSNSENTVNSNIGSVQPTSNPLSTIESYDLSLDMNSCSGSHGNFTTGKVKTIYKTTDDLNTNYITPYINDTNKSAYNVLSVTGYEKGKVGKQTLKVNTAYGAATYDIYVVDEVAYQDEQNNYVVTVNKNYSGEIGAVDGTNGNMFTTISQALEFLQDTDRVPYEANKILNIGAGYYYEKLEITTANLSILGAGTAKGTYTSDENYDSDEFNNATIIEFDSLYGRKDINGFTQDTNSTQTVQVGESATNCQMHNLTISNKWNCKGYFDEMGVSNEHRALAILIRADQFVMINCSLLGYQDTIELFKGRQYFYNTFISGVTDFIFGTNNTTLFDHCDIHTIYNGSTDGGYINAFKGTHSSNGSDSVKYGAIYYKCYFTKDSNVTTSNTSIARAWDAYSKVAVIECNLDSHISTAAYTENATKNERYVAWDSTGKNAPTLDTIEYLEYGNEGSGAISATQNGMTYLTASEAADYHDYSVIFGKTNGNVSYSLAWDPYNGLEEDNNIYYVFHSTAPTTGTSYEFDPADCDVSGNYTVGAMTFTNCQRRTNGNDDLMVNGSISFDVKAGTTVTVNSYPGYHYYRIGDIYADSDSVSFYFDTATTVTINHTGSTFYLYSIVINETLDAPSAAILSSITVSGQPTSDFQVGDDYDLSNLKVKAHYNDGTYRNVTTFTTDADTVINKNAAGEYTVTVTYNDGTTTKTASFTVNYVASVNNTISEDIITSFKGSHYSAYSATVYADTFNSSSSEVTINKITYNKIQSNGSAGNWISYSNGSSITMEVDSACALYLGFYYTSGISTATVTINDKTVSKCRAFRYDNKVELDSLRDQYGDFARYVIPEAGTITITFNGSGYLGAVGVLFNDGIQDIVENAVIEDDVTITFGNSSNIDSVSGVSYTATISPNGSNSQVKDGAITLSVKSGAKVTVYGYGGSNGTGAGDYTSYTVTANGSTSPTQAGDYEVTANADGDVIITAVDSNNYLISISIEYPAQQVVISSNTNINFGSTGNYSTLISNGTISSTATIVDNGDNSNNSQVKNGSIEFYVADGATVTIYGNNLVDYVANGVEVSGSGLNYNEGQHVVNPDSDGKVTIDCNRSGNNYFYYIVITF